MLSSDSVHTEYSHADEVQTLSTTVLFGCYGYDAATYVSSFPCFRLGDTLEYGNTFRAIYTLWFHQCAIIFAKSYICDSQPLDYVSDMADNDASVYSLTFHSDSEI